MFIYFKYLIIMLFIISVVGYILSVLREKLFLKNNMIVINKKSVTQDHLDEADMKEFIFDGNRVKSGDEVKVVLKGNKRLEGIVIGARKRDRIIILVTHKDEVKKLSIDNIKKFKIISKYGKFFTVLK